MLTKYTNQLIWMINNKNIAGGNEIDWQNRKRWCISHDIKQKGCKDKDDELIQTWRKRVAEFFSKCSWRSKPQLPEGKQEQRWVKGRVDKSDNIYQKNHYQPEREMGLWIPEFESDEQQDQNCLNQHSTWYRF